MLQAGRTPSAFSGEWRALRTGRAPRLSPFKDQVMNEQYASIIDVRRIPHHKRHALIFGTFDALPGGEALQLINDHDPKPLYYQLEERAADSFEWTYLEAGPSQWRVQIAKRGDALGHYDAGDSCCSGGGCGG
ncbi:DUF2249 domain-containing protein [Burkholderia pseudomallei]|uniref:DUF2249 domain-containing protein n=1 Tax=Burkholderia pseudomallei TaxID=28450 RepID=UPI0001736AF5|nr:DUF2249 domain-containing protein [Burkholderia pseudomallei]EDU11846.1 conserved hypothetical protein [Burkholderia pseudomallei 1655]EMP76440.1 hypothetical protein D512_14241 [Burkholderia pseudomallei MSHR1043]UZU16105.1 DUF2249 domain-containing protein [Burkholderia pseudomallei]UZU24051.1 DUF2249 domain-containing protein [Burkholderia pseudomallei]UZU28609.1 DUF2249 domain-containing protein [Burkholderia pseudomallei]